MGYTQPGLFVYRVTHTGAGQKLLSTDTLGFFATDAPIMVNKKPTGHTVSQWQRLHAGAGGWVLGPDVAGNVTEGSRACDTELFIHPPRYGQYRALQFCPYPLFVNNKTGNWSWDFAVGGNWAMPPIYPIVGVDTFHVSYKNEGLMPYTAALGRLPCSKVKAVSVSVYGRAEAVYYLNNDLGIVSSTARTVNGEVFLFELLEHKRGVDVIAFNPYMANVVRKAGEKRDAGARQLLGIGN